MDDVSIVEASHHMGYDSHFLDCTKESVAQAFPLACTLYQAGNVYELHSCRNYPSRRNQLHDLIQSGVRYIYHANVWIDGAEGIVCSLCRSRGDS